MASLGPRPFPPDRFLCASMEGKTWKIWSHAVTLGRQRVGTRKRHVKGDVWWGISKPFLVNVSPRAGGHSLNKAASVPCIVHDTRNGLAQNGNYCSRALTPCVFSLSTLGNCSWPNLPGLPFYCTWSKARSGNSLGTRLCCRFHGLYSPLRKPPCLEPVLIQCILQMLKVTPEGVTNNCG